MSLTKTDIQSIKTALQPEFANLEKKLTSKIERLRRENRKDHNLVIDVFDKRSHKIEDRLLTLENKSTLPTFKNL